MNKQDNQSASSYDEYLNLKFRCYNCNSGPSNFSTIMSRTGENNMYKSKYLNFCSMGCIMSYHNKTPAERKKSEKSRCSTPT